MKDGLASDSSRMFAFLSVICQSPIIWYTSGPVQKFLLRQIRVLDSEQMAVVTSKSEFSGDVNQTDASDIALDACLIMLYGHILFASTSYTYALGENPGRRLGFFFWVANLSKDTFFVHVR